MTRRRLSRKAGTLRKDISEERNRASGVRAGRPLQRAISLDDFRRPRAGELLQALHGILQQGGVAALGRETRPLDEHGDVVGLEREQLVEQPLCVGVGIRSARVLDLLNERGARLQVAGIELDSAAQMRDALVAPATRRLETTHEECDVARRRRQDNRLFDRLGRSVELTQSQLRQAEVGPRRWLARRERRSPA